MTNPRLEGVTMSCIKAANCSHCSASKLFKGCQVPQPMEDAGKEIAREHQNSFQREHCVLQGREIFSSASCFIQLLPLHTKSQILITTS